MPYLSLTFSVNSMDGSLIFYWIGNKEKPYTSYIYCNKLFLITELTNKILNYTQ